LISRRVYLRKTDSCIYEFAILGYSLEFRCKFLAVFAWRWVEVDESKGWFVDLSDEVPIIQVGDGSRGWNAQNCQKK
jgi:hypothetical protein